MKRIIFYFGAALILAVVVALSACERNIFFNGEMSERVVYLYLDFWNPNTTGSALYGDAPQIAFNAEKTSKAAKIDFNKDFRGEIIESGGKPIDAQIIIDNIRIVDDFGNFKILRIVPEEYREGSWVTLGAENDVVFDEKKENIDIVLVLDKSESLGEDFNAMKKHAIKFVNTINSQVSNPRFGVISFSTDIDTLEITSEITSVNSHINALALTSGRTALYRSMNAGVDLLKESDGQSKVLVTFTDGLNDDVELKDYNTVLAKLEETGSDSIKIQSYTIGLGDAVNEDILSDLAVRGTAVFPEDTKQLEEFFDFFASVVSTVYGFTYKRIPDAIPESTPVQVRFKIYTAQQ